MARFECDFTDSDQACISVWQWSFGQQVELIGDNIAAGMTVQWDYPGITGVDSRTITADGDDLYAVIPNDALEQGEDFVGYIYYSSVSVGETRYVINVNVRERTTSTEVGSTDTIPSVLVDIEDEDFSHETGSGTMLNGRLDKWEQRQIDTETDIGDRLYTEENIITDDETITESLDALDIGITSLLTNVRTFDLSKEKLPAEADYTLAFQRIATALENDDTILIPKGDYGISSMITITGVRNITIDCKGAIIATGCSGLKFSNCMYLKGNIEISLSAINWTDAYAGITLDRVYYSTLFITAISGFKYGMLLQNATGGVAYNTFHIGNLLNNQYALYINPTDAGFVTECLFIGGRYGCDSNAYPSLADSWGVYCDRNPAVSTINNLRWYAPCLESLKNGMYLDVLSCLIDSARYEAVDDSHLSGTMVQSIVHIGFTHGGVNGLDTTKVKLSTVSRYNNFIGRYGSSLSTFTTETSYGGFGFRNYDGNGDILATLSMIRSRFAIHCKDAADIEQIFNKQYANAGQPAAGTYAANAISWNTNTASGQPIGYICTGVGTMGTLSGITASGTSGEYTVTVNSITGLYVGAKIAITGGIVFTTIANIDGLVLTLDHALSGDVTDAAVSFYPATWKALPSYIA